MLYSFRRLLAVKSLAKSSTSYFCSLFVPRYERVSPEDLKELLQFLSNHERIAVLTGAGISTESGIPDYRSEDVGLYARSNHKPIQYQEFVKSSYARRRYWARNFIGWPRFSKIEPNTIHFALKDLEMIGKVSAVITQNVDNLHFKAGSKNVLELHGTSYRIICLNCDNNFPRHILQDIFIELNPSMKAETTMIRPDGDVEINENQVKSFKIPDCNRCGGILKPDVVFFGDNVPKLRVERIKSEITSSDALLVLGTSLSTYSAYRIVLQAKEENKEVMIINIGKTRGDREATVKISTKCGDILPDITRKIIHIK